MFHYKPSILGYPIYGNPPYVWGWSHEASCKEMHCLFRHVLLASFSVQVCSSLRNDLEEFFVGTRWNYCIYKDINICFLTWQHALIFFPGKENQRHPAVFRWFFFFVLLRMRSSSCSSQAEPRKSLRRSRKMAARDDHCLVVWNMNLIFPSIGNVIIPIDELIFFKMIRLSKPPTRSFLNVFAIFRWGKGPFWTTWPHRHPKNGKRLINLRGNVSKLCN